MNKKFAVIMLAAVLAGCASNSSVSSAGSDEKPVQTIMPETQTGDVNTGNNHVLIAWFSRVGNSDFDEDVDAVTGASTNIDNGVLRGNNSYIEETAERETGADTYFIQVDDLYPGSFNDTVEQFVQEEKNDTFHALGSRVENMDQYDTIILIYPTWDSTLPSPVRTFLKSYDFTGKKIYPVNSNDGYGMGDSVNRIEQYAPGAEVMEAFSIDDDDIKDMDSELTSYLKEQGLSK